MASAVLSQGVYGPRPDLDAPMATEAARARAFRAARRHTWLVRALKVVLPLASLSLLVLYPLTVKRALDVGPGRLSYDRIDAGAEHLIMENPSYEGFDKRGNRYRVHARSATLDPSRKAPILLAGIEARLRHTPTPDGPGGTPATSAGRNEQSNTTETRLTATRGIFDQTRHELDLRDAIDVVTSSGITARLTSAKVYARENKVVSLEPLEAAMPTGKLRAGAMVLHARTREAEFTDGVEVELVAPKGGLAKLAATGETRRPAVGSRGGNGGGGAAEDGAGGQEPIRVAAAALVIDDTARLATFRRNVRARQGEMLLTTRELSIEYTGSPVVVAPGLGGGPGVSARGTASEAAAPKRNEVERITARDGVVVTSGTDRRLTGETAVFDAQADTVLLTGDVVATQGKNVLRGRRLSLDRARARLALDAPAQAGASAGRITAVFYQNAGQRPRASDAPRAPSSTAASGEAGSGFGGLVTEFRADPTAPVDIEADRLDVDDRTRTATFRGAVRAAQGGFLMRAAEIVAHYSGGGGLAMAERAGAAGNSALSRIEARRDVVITSKEGQKATGDRAVFDTETNTVTLSGRVIVSQGKNVIEGERLVIDTVTGLSRFEHASGKTARPTVAPPTLPARSATVTGAPPNGVASKPKAPAAPGSPGRPCPPGRTCLMLFPKESAPDKGGPRRPGTPSRGNLSGNGRNDAWQPTTSASPVMRSE
jgi:lipopolysaccharide transport protein LptA